MNKILLIEPPGDYIRLDRCMQSIDSWGGAYRFPLNLARIAAHLMQIGKEVQFIDLQANLETNLEDVLLDFRPELCILSSGFPSMYIDSKTAHKIKSILPSTHVSTFGVVPTLLKDSFFHMDTWGFEIHFDSIVIGGEPAYGYETIITQKLKHKKLLVDSQIDKRKRITTEDSRLLFNHSLYKSPFTGQNATYVEGTYGCPHRCNFCVVPVLYNGRFSKRAPEDIVNEFRFVIEQNNVKQITLWDEGTTFHLDFINELCDRIIKLRSQLEDRHQDFIWTTRSTTSLLNKETVEKLAISGLSGITLGIESFDTTVLSSVEKGNSVEENLHAIQLLKEKGIISIGHFILGHLNDSHESIIKTIEEAHNSDLNFAQFYCAVPYPGTKLHNLANSLDLIRVRDLTQYELSNPIMDTIHGVSHTEVAMYRKEAISKFWTNERWAKLNDLLQKNTGHLISEKSRNKIVNWNHADMNSLKDSNIKPDPLLFEHNQKI